MTADLASEVTMMAWTALTIFVVSRYGVIYRHGWLVLSVLPLTLFLGMDAMRLAQMDPLISDGHVVLWLARWLLFGLLMAHVARDKINPYMDDAWRWMCSFTDTAWRWVIGILNSFWNSL